MKKHRSLTRAVPAPMLPKDLAIGVCWYTPEDWKVIKTNAADPDRFEASFVEWEKMANDTIALLRKRAPGVVKVLVSANELLAWCYVEGRTNDASARSAYVQLLMCKGPVL